MEDEQQLSIVVKRNFLFLYYSFLSFVLLRMYSICNGIHGGGGGVGGAWLVGPSS